MKSLNIILLIFVSLSSLTAKNIVIDNLKETKHINLSRSDTNRMVFPSKIKKQISSQEKDLLVTVTGNEMFVKFAPYREEEQVKVGGKTVTKGTSNIVYNKAMVNELFVVTKDKTYSFILHPKKQESTTVTITESFKNKIDAIRLDLKSDTSFVKNIANDLILNILKNSPLRGYETKKVNKDIGSVYIPEIRANMNVSLFRTYKGYKYTINEYNIENKNDFILSIPDTKKILYSIVDRKEFLVSYSLYYGNRIYKILPNDIAKLIVIKYSDEGQL
mgnify:FL=1